MTQNELFKYSDRKITKKNLANMEILVCVVYTPSYFDNILRFLNQYHFDSNFDVSYGIWYILSVAKLSEVP